MNIWIWNIPQKFMSSLVPHGNGVWRGLNNKDTAGPGERKWILKRLPWGPSFSLIPSVSFIFLSIFSFQCSEKFSSAKPSHHDGILSSTTPSSLMVSLLLPRPPHDGLPSSITPPPRWSPFFCPTSPHEGLSSSTTPLHGGVSLTTLQLDDNGLKSLKVWASKPFLL